jgi:peptidoglycan/LPS O-acetylase OafA/YrhL
MVMSVHAGLPVPGGRVGLELYFVISGFVITGVILRQHSTGGFKFGQFYWRRFKRLTPALALVIATTMVLSFCLLSPFGPQQLTAQTGLGTMLLTANFVITYGSDHFHYSAPGGAYPLLHTWSLSLEEQYYLIFPAILALSFALCLRWRRIRWEVALIGTGAAISFWLAMSGPSALGPLAPFSEYLVGFGGPLSRAWEFLVGALLAFAMTSQWVRSDKLAQFLAWLGAAAIAGSVWLINVGTPFPNNSWTVLPVCGTLLIVIAGTYHSTWVNRALAFPPIAKIGDRSYSIYLWHWPLMAFAFYLWPQVHIAPVLAGALAVLPAMVSYRWVEQPLRRLPSLSRSRTLALIGAVVLPPILLAAAVNVAANKYWLPRYQSEAVPIAHHGDTGLPEFFQHFRETYYPCSDPTLRDGADVWDGMARCWQSKPESRIDVALVGDSHAEQLFPGLAEALPDKNIVYYTREVLPVRSAAGMDLILDRVASNPGIKTVIVAADWASRGVPKEEIVKTLENFRSTAKAVFVTDDIPRFPFDAVFCKYRTTPTLPLSQCSDRYEQFEALYATYYPALRAAVAAVPGVQLVNTAESFCDNQTCSMNKGEALLYRDESHLNNVGSRFVADRMLTVFPQFRARVTRP